MNTLDPFEINSMILTYIIFLPLIGGILISLLPKSSIESKIPHKAALLFSLLTFFMSLVLTANFKALSHGTSGFNFQFTDKFSWIPMFDINYHVAVDGLSLPMVLLTSLIMVIAILASWKVEKLPNLYFALLMVMQTAIIGVFTSMDLFLFFVMWELELIPMYILIGIWGGQKREYAAMKFILYTAFASAFMFIVFIAIYLSAGTFNYIELMTTSKPFLALGLGWKTIAFLALFICFAVKLPMVPLHTWLPDAHVQAPTAISILLAGVLLKMGSYGIIRFNLGLFPDVLKNNPHIDIGFWLATLGTISILYGAFLALAQTDMKKVIAYSSVSHMGFVLLGISSFNTEGMNGAILQMFTHGTITALMFLFVGVVYDRTHTREISRLGGLGKQMPMAAALFVAISLAGVAAPGMSSFVSEFLVFVGAFKVYPIITSISIFSIIIGAGYTLWLNERVFFGEMPKEWNKLKDINKMEFFSAATLLFIVVATGLYPAFLLDIINPATKQIIQLLTI